ncbi:MAG: inner membrane CreD family protein [Myxococcota bacterium]
MRLFFRLFWLGLIWGITSIGWLTLGGVMGERTYAQERALDGKVADLWGAAQQQQAPGMVFEWTVDRQVIEKVKDTETGQVVEKQKTVTDTYTESVHLASSDIDVQIDLDQRRKGLLWFPLYDVSFQAAYTYTHRQPQSGELMIAFPFPNTSGLYDDFRFAIDGAVDPNLQPQGGQVVGVVPVAPGQEVTVSVGYRSRGMGEWSYVPLDGVAALNQFSLTMDTDFEDIDFPAYALSPSGKERQGEGWRLSWDFDRVITGHSIGMVMPERVQPGPLAEYMAFSAPISLGFFFLILFVLSVLRQIDLHPINYMMVAGAFFAFHLLFGYSADHLPVEAAFALASVASVVLVVSYLRLVVSDRFAFGPVAAAQLIYLVGFSLAHFWEGYTGLTVTILSVLTLFVLMQLTGHVNWEDEFRKARHQIKS